MSALDKKRYEDFYIAYFDASGRIIYPSNIEEVKIIKEMLKNHSEDNYVFTEDRNLCYKVRMRKTLIDGVKVQMFELSNVTEFMNQISKASVDDITHLGNRKIARNLFMQYIEQAYRKQEDFAIILADLDGFKEVNDTYGHITGDVVLSEVSRMLYCSTRQESYRPQDIVGRLGGDEFVVIMKNISNQVAQERAEKIIRNVEQHKVALFSESAEVSYIGAGTLSMGLYHVTSEELTELYNKGYTTDEIRKVLIDRCDSALYSSKNNGKNQITSFSKERHLKLENGCY